LTVLPMVAEKAVPSAGERAAQMELPWAAEKGKWLAAVTVVQWGDARAERTVDLTDGPRAADWVAHWAALWADRSETIPVEGWAVSMDGLKAELLDGTTAVTRVDR
jgi:hypothetical protein